MSDILCSYNDREAALIAYLYDETTPPEREAFEGHLKTCARCRVELNGLGGVRAQLSEWSAPAFAGHKSPLASRKAVVDSLAEWRGTNDERPTWRNIPAWARYAAAVLVLGISAGAANLNVHYDAQSGLNIRTGWIQERGPRSSEGPKSDLQTAAIDAVTHSELTALEQQLRNEMRTQSAPAARTVIAPPADGETVRRVRALLDETERRHERELALKVAEVMHDVNIQRQADLRKIDQNIDQGRVEVLRNRQMLDYYMQRASQRQ